MFRIAALALVIGLIGFSFYWSNVPEEDRIPMPAPIAAAASSTAHMVSNASRAFDRVAGPSIRLALHRLNEKWAEWRQPKDDGREILMAMNLDLTATDYTARHLPGAAFTNSILLEANFTKTYLSAAGFDSVEASHANFTDAILTGASAKGAQFRESLFQRTDLSRLAAQGSVFDGTTIHNSDLSASQFSGASFIDSEWQNSDADRSIFYAAIFTRSTLTDSQFKRANFDRALFRDVTIKGGDFTGATFKESNFSGANLLEAPLTQEQLDEACGDDETLLPEGAQIRSCLSEPIENLASSSEG